MRATISERIRRDANRRALWQGIAVGLVWGLAIVLAAWRLP